MTSAAHSLFSASAADRWGNCAGSLAMSQGIPDSGSDAAKEGTAGHALGEQCLKDGTDPVDFIGDTLLDVEITDDLALNVREYVEYVRGMDGIVYLETRINYAHVLQVPLDDAFGTADCVIWHGNTVKVIDLKLGRRWVDVKNNWQLTLYAAGVVLSLEEIGEEVDRIELHIFQPRVSKAVVPHVYTREELQDMIELLRQAAARAQEATASFTGMDNLDWIEQYLTVGEAQCQWCRAKAVCPKLKAEADDFFPSAAQDSDFDIVSVLQVTPDEDIAEALDRMPLVELYMKAVRTEAFARIAQGKTLPGYKLTMGREGHRRWKDPAKIVEHLTLVEGVPEDLLYKKEVFTPPQLEKVLKKSKMKVDFEDFITRNPAKPSLAPVSHPGEPWTGAVTDADFD